MKPSLLQEALAAVSVEAFSERAAEELARIHAAAEEPERAKIGELFEVLLSMADDDQRLWMRQLKGSAAGRGDSSAHNALDRLEARVERLDAKAKNCTVGYSCGSTCIPKSKVCRVSAGAAGKKLAQLTAAPQKQAAPADLPKATLKKLRPLSGGAQEAVYQARGYNAKPEVVSKKSDLKDRKDLLADESGQTLILSRGMRLEAGSNYAESFKRGDLHFVGGGGYGNGTYAAAGKESEEVAFMYAGLKPDEAKDYFGANANEALNMRLVAFGLKRSSSVVQNQTIQEFNKFETSTIRKAKALLKSAGNTKPQIADLGMAAAILGIDAYSVPSDPGQSYWVVLNRGAVVVADDGEW